MGAELRMGRRRAEPSAPWVPLHLESHYSFGRGTASVKELVDRLASDGVEAAALADRDNLYALPRFRARCLERGIKPLTAVELTEPPRVDPLAAQADRRRLSSHHPSLWHAPKDPGRAGPSRVLLLARDRGGYERMCRLVTLRSEAERVPRSAPKAPALPQLLAAVGTGGLFVLTDDASLATALLRQGIVPREALRLLLVRPGPRREEARLREVADRDGIGLVADPDPAVLEPEDHRLQLLLRAIRTGTSLGSTALAPGAWAEGRHLPRPAEVLERYYDVPEALAETCRLARACSHDVLDPPLPLPRPPDVSAEEAPRRLASLVRERLAEARANGGSVGPRYDDRVEKELEVIAARGLSGYFLVLGEILMGAREQRIPVAGRGSAVASLVGHLLGLSPVDPVEAGLYFERFLHRRRADLPDIDVDVSSARREQLIEWTHHRFGRGHVAPCCAFHRFGRRSAWREGLKALGVSAPRAERILEAVRRGEPEANRLLDDLPAWTHRDIERLVGRPRYVAMHPGGMVVMPLPLDRIAPVETLVDGRRILQYDAASLSALGLAKIDLLGSRALAEMEVATTHLETTRELSPELRRQLERHGPAAVPSGDADALALIDRADTLGVAELETPAVRAVLEQVPIRRIEDVVAALALVRPGASAGHAKARFVRRARGKLDGRDGPHPLLEHVLAATHGVLLYEEDQMRVIAEATGLDLERADGMRADLIDGQDDPEALSRMEEAFLRQASRRGIERAEASRIWTELVRFAAYSFNKAHATGHALLAYQGAFFRVHAPVAFACGVLDQHGGDYPMRTVAAAIGRWGVQVRRPHVAHSRERTIPEDEQAVRLGLRRVKGLSTLSCRRIVAAREAGPPYRDLEDFLERARPSADEASTLVLLGSCDGLDPVDPALYPFLHEGLVDALRGRAESFARLARELAKHVRRRLDDREPESVARYRALVRVRNELQFLQMHLSTHPLTILRAEAEALGCRTAADAAGAVGERLRVAALLGAARRLTTRGGRRLRFLTLEDESGLLEARLRPAVESAQGHRVTTPGPYLVAGVVRDDHGHPYLDIDEIHPFHWRRAREEPRVHEVGSRS